MPLLTEILGALVAGALVVVIALQLGVDRHRAVAAVAVVAVVVAALLVGPKFREDVNALRTQHDQYAALSDAEAEEQGGVAQGLDVEFLAWAHGHLKEGETFHLEIGSAPGEEQFEGLGIKEQAAFAWASYQLGPNLMVEQNGLTDTVEGEGQNADWIVFYQSNPDEYPGHLGKVLTYAPEFAIARTAGAG